MAAPAPGAPWCGIARHLRLRAGLASGAGRGSAARGRRSDDSAFGDGGQAPSVCAVRLRRGGSGGPTTRATPRERAARPSFGGSTLRPRCRAANRSPIWRRRRRWKAACGRALDARGRALDARGGRSRSRPGARRQARVGDGCRARCDATEGGSTCSDGPADGRSGAGATGGRSATRARRNCVTRIARPTFETPAPDSRRE